MTRYTGICALLVVAACDPAGRSTAPLEISADRLGRPDIVVHAGGSIQAAVDAASPGAVIAIEPGVYAEAVHVATPGLRLVGRRAHDGSGVVIANPGGTAPVVRTATVTRGKSTPPVTRK